jgi:hypothetical protein
MVGDSFTPKSVPISGDVSMKDALESRIAQTPFSDVAELIRYIIESHTDKTCSPPRLSNEGYALQKKAESHARELLRMRIRNDARTVEDLDAILADTEQAREALDYKGAIKMSTESIFGTDIADAYTALFKMNIQTAETIERINELLSRASKRYNSMGMYSGTYREIDQLADVRKQQLKA